MLVKSIKLINYRNYKSLTIDFSERINVIYGDNGQGKTNILEAIFLCASGRSHRTSKDNDLVLLGQQGYYVKLGVKKGEMDSSIEVTYKPGEKKRIRINEIPLTKIGELMGHLNVVIFSPEDMLVIKEGPSERRRFIDITLSQLKPSYFYDLQQYSKILTQRNSLLKDIQHNRSLMDTLEIWDQNLVKTGSRIIRVRNEFIKKLSKTAMISHRKLTNENEELEVRYVPSIGIDGSSEIGEIEDRFLKEIARLRNKEIFKNTTLCGPQRDDYEIYINGKNIKVFGSQGQQRTAILSVKLAEIEMMRDNTGENPVLLLDDVMSELDTKRQEYLLSSIGDIQTFITCTDRCIYDEKLSVSAGMININAGEASLV